MELENPIAQELIQELKKDGKVELFDLCICFLAKCRMLIKPKTNKIVWPHFDSSYGIIKRKLFYFEGKQVF